MHGTIYQVSITFIDEDDYLNIDDVEGGEDAFVDYADYCSKKERAEAIKRLAEEILPKGMFTLNPDLTLTYNGGFKSWHKSYFDSILKATKEITPANVLEKYGKVYDMKKVIVNPLNTSSLFVTDFAHPEVSAERSIVLMRLIGCMVKGEKLYIGSVLDHHYY